MEFVANLPVVLASASPRRRELLSVFGFPFTIEPSRKEEPDPAGFSSPVSYVLECAEQKALKVAENCPGSLVIGADTVVVLDEEILLKPKDREEARASLQKLSGETHEVITAVVLVDDKGALPFYERTEVTFQALPDEWIDAYIQTEDPYDKAGAYGIQTISGLFVRKISGDYNNVVGLPLSHLAIVLQNYGYISVKESNGNK